MFRFVFACIVLVFSIMAIRQISRLDAQVAELTRAVNLLAKAPADALDSDKAIALGKEEIKNGRWDVGQLYMVNAVTNAPRRVEHLTAYASAILDGSSPPRDALERLASVLQLAAYQVDSADVPKVMALIERVEQARKPAPDDGPSPPAQAIDWSARWEATSKVDPDAWKDPVRLGPVLKALEEFASDLEEQGGGSPDLKAKVAAEIARWAEVAQLAKQCNYVDACLARLDGGEDLATDRAVAIVQAAENVLPSFWGADPKAMPAGLKAKIDGYPEAIKKMVQRIGDERSGRSMEEIRKIVGSAPKSNPGDKYQARCKALEVQVKQAQMLATQLPSTDKLVQAQELIAKKTSELQKLRNEQYSAYQQWAIKWSEWAFEEYMQFRVDVSEADALGILAKYKLAEIDQSLLSPEVSKVFNDILGKFLGELGPRALVVEEKKMGTEKKKTLEDF